VQTIAIIIYVLTGLVGLVLSFILALQEFGIALALLGVIFFPVLFLVFPWYLVVVHGVWLLVLVNYGGLVLSSVFFMLSKD